MKRAATIGLGLCQIVLALVLQAGCCCDRTPDGHAPKNREPDTSPASMRRLDLARTVLNRKGEEPMSLLEHEFLAQEMMSTWVNVGGGFYAAGFGDQATLYVFNEMKGRPEQLPALLGPISSGGTIEPNKLKDMMVISKVAPLRYLRRPEGGFWIGLFDPGHHVFFRWRGQVRQQEQILFDPSSDAVSPEVLPQRVYVTVDIDPPADMHSREPI